MASKISKQRPLFYFPKLVREKTSHILSLKSMICRNLGINIPGNSVKKLREEDAEILFNQPQTVMKAKVSISIMQFLSRRLSEKSQSEVGEFLKILGLPNRSISFIGKKEENLL